MEKKLFKKLEKIAKERCEFITTLEEEKCDDLDFLDISKWALVDMMTKAYELGKAEMQKELNKK